MISDGVAALGDVVVIAGDAVIGMTRILFLRPDVNAAHRLPPTVRTGFAVQCRVPESLRSEPGIVVRIAARFADGSVGEIGSRRLRFSAYDYRVSGHGYVLADTFDAVLLRDQIYASGPPSPVADPTCVELIARYLEPGQRVVDVGCGIGAYGHALGQRGFSWTGCEVRPDFVERARADGLDARVVENGRLPFSEKQFDVAIAVEVLEHVQNFDGLVGEMRRVAPRAFFSVPNFEAIPVTSSFYALPWHMLEPDHRNFFARASLASTLKRWYDEVEVLEYGPLPLLRAQDGLPVFNHLFAIAAVTT